MSRVDRNTLIKVAKLYYNANQSQEQIAEILGVSRPKVSRMLDKARKMRIVEFKIIESPLLIAEMEEKLKAVLGLNYVKIVSSGANEQQMLQVAGCAAGEYLNTLLINGMRIGISWGTTMDAVVAHFTPQRQIQNAMVVQLVGGANASTFNVDCHELTIVLARKLGASSSILRAPQLVSSKAVRDTLLAEPEFAAHFRLFSQLDVALVGIGSTKPEQSVPYKAGYISLQEAAELVTSGFATDICGSRIYKDGSIRSTTFNDRLIAIPVEILRSIPNVIAVAVGSDKAEPIISAAEGKFLNALITDEVAAISILGMKHERWKDPSSLLE